MWSPPSSDRSSPTAAIDEQILREFAREEGVPFERLRRAVEGNEDELSIVEAFFRAPAGSPVLVADRFELIEQVGQGSYGRVFRAHDRGLSRQVAVKVMSIGDPDIADQEGRVLAALEHPNIVRIYDHGRKDDYRWLVLEWLDGETLFEWCPGKSSREVLARYIEAGEGLAAARSSPDPPEHLRIRGCRFYRQAHGGARFTD